LAKEVFGKSRLSDTNEALTFTSKNSGKRFHAEKIETSLKTINSNETV
jgi:hypothetical protein